MNSMSSTSGSSTGIPPIVDQAYTQLPLPALDPIELPISRVIGVAMSIIGGIGLLFISIAISTQHPVNIPLFNLIVITPVHFIITGIAFVALGLYLINCSYEGQTSSEEDTTALRKTWQEKYTELEIEQRKTAKELVTAQDEIQKMKEHLSKFFGKGSSNVSSAAPPSSKNVNTRANLSHYHPSSMHTPNTLRRTNSVTEEIIATSGLPPSKVRERSASQGGTPSGASSSNGQVNPSFPLLSTQPSFPLSSANSSPLGSQGAGSESVSPPLPTAPPTSLIKRDSRPPSPSPISISPPPPIPPFTGTPSPVITDPKPPVTSTMPTLPRRYSAPNRRRSKGGDVTPTNTSSIPAPPLPIIDKPSSSPSPSSSSSPIDETVSSVPFVNTGSARKSSVDGSKIKALKDKLNLTPVPTPKEK